jgi:hypothetical protein
MLKFHFINQEHVHRIEVGGDRKIGDRLEIQIRHSTFSCEQFQGIWKPVGIPRLPAGNRNSQPSLVNEIIGQKISVYSNLV